jgi:HK97 family phage portal protein
MRFLGINISIGRKSADDISHWAEEAGGWWPVIREGFAGAWQQNITIKRETLLAFTPVFACIQRITTDVGKMPVKLMEYTNDQIWTLVTRNTPYAAVLRKPNDYQSMGQFIIQWLISKLLAGNAYILKVRDSRGIVVKLYPLDPTRVRPLITPTGDVYYQLGYDPLSELFDGTVVAPAEEIIHDRMPGLFHPLVGTSPVFACALPAAQGHSMQRASAAFFKNMAQPSGVLTAPGAISDTTATRLKKEWNEKFSGNNVGKVAVLGDGLKFEAMTITAAAAQAVEQLKLSGEQVCTAFGVPSFMVGVSPAPALNNIEALIQLYWSQCLQFHIEGVQCGLTEGLGLYDSGMPMSTCIMLDLDALLKMDTNTRYAAYKNAISGGWMAPNDARRRENLKPSEGGDTPYLQQQNYSLAALARRDAAQPAPSTAPGGGTAALPNPDKEDQADSTTDEGIEEDQAALKHTIKSLALNFKPTSAVGQRECA